MIVSYLECGDEIMSVCLFGNFLYLIKVKIKESYLPLPSATPFPREEGGWVGVDRDTRHTFQWLEKRFWYLSNLFGCLASKEPQQGLFWSLIRYNEQLALLAVEIYDNPFITFMSKRCSKQPSIAFKNYESVSWYVFVELLPPTVGIHSNHTYKNKMLVRLKGYFPNFATSTPSPFIWEYLQNHFGLITMVSKQNLNT